MPRTRKQAERESYGNQWQSGYWSSSNYRGNKSHPQRLEAEDAHVLRVSSLKLTGITGINEHSWCYRRADMKRIALESRLFKLEAEEKCIESCIQAAYSDVSPMQKLDNAWLRSSLHHLMQRVEVESSKRRRHAPLFSYFKTINISIVKDKNYVKIIM